MTREKALSMCKIQYISFPVYVVNGTTIEIDPHNKYLILINKDHSQTQQQFTLEHELAHIRLNHFYDPDKPIQICEQEADEMALAEISNMTFQSP